jgi:hypothetical protein
LFALADPEPFTLAKRMTQSLQLSIGFISDLPVERSRNILTFAKLMSGTARHKSRNAGKRFHLSPSLFLWEVVLKHTNSALCFLLVR